MGTQDITLVELALLNELSQQRSLRSLARRRGLQASHVSKVLHRLEKKLGTALVKRSPKGILLTPDGMRLVPIARAILENARGLVGRDSVAPISAAAPLIGIAAPRFICSDLLAPLLGRVREKTTGYRFRLLDMAPDQIGPAAIKSACELTLTLSLPSLTPAWHVRKVGDLRWALFAGKDHPIGKNVDEAEALLYPFVVPNYWTGTTFEMGDDYCPVAWNQRQRGDETSAIASGIEIVRTSDRQLVFAPIAVARRFVLNGQLREIGVRKWPEVSKPVFLAAHSDRVPQSLFRGLLQELKSALL